MDDLEWLFANCDDVSVEVRTTPSLKVVLAKNPKLKGDFVSDAELKAALASGKIVSVVARHPECSRSFARYGFTPRLVVSAARRAVEVWLSDRDLIVHFN